MAQQITPHYLTQTVKDFKTAMSQGYLVKDQYFVKFPLHGKSASENTCLTLNCIFEQQMLSLLIIMDGEHTLELNAMNELLIVKEGTVTEYYGMRYNMEVMNENLTSRDFDRSAFLAVKYFADLHVNKGIFHGDIKPANIFVEILGSSFINTDSGTLLMFDRGCRDDNKPVY